MACYGRDADKIAMFERRIEGGVYDWYLELAAQVELDWATLRQLFSAKWLEKVPECEYEADCEELLAPLRDSTTKKCTPTHYDIDYRNIVSHTNLEDAFEASWDAQKLSLAMCKG